MEALIAQKKLMSFVLIKTQSIITQLEYFPPYQEDA